MDTSPARCPAGRPLLSRFFAPAAPISKTDPIHLELTTALGNHVERVYDCGVAGLHRLVPHLDRLSEANAIIAATPSRNKALV